MSKVRPEYYSYLLRVWRESDDEQFHRRTSQAVWRVSLENALTGKRYGFGGLDELFKFLRRETGMVHDGTEKDNSA